MSYVALLVCCNCMKNNTVKVTAAAAKKSYKHNRGYPV